MSSRLILVVIVALSFSSTFVNGQSISAEELLKKSINYHDPKDILTSKEVTFELGVVSHHLRLMGMPISVMRTSKSIVLQRSALR